MSFTSYTVNAMRCFYHGRVYCTQIVLNMFNKIEDYEMVRKKHTHTLAHSHTAKLYFQREKFSMHAYTNDSIT